MWYEAHFFNAKTQSGSGAMVRGAHPGRRSLPETVAATVVLDQPAWLTMDIEGL